MAPGLGSLASFSLFLQSHLSSVMFEIPFTALVRSQCSGAEFWAKNSSNQGFHLLGPGDDRETQPKGHGTRDGPRWVFRARTPHAELVLGDAPQRDGLRRQQLLTEMHLPSRSFSGVSAVYQSEGGPVPFTVMAATWKLYWLPFSSPV